MKTASVRKELENISSVVPIMAPLAEEAEDIDH